MDHIIDVGLIKDQNSKNVHIFVTPYPSCGRFLATKRGRQNDKYILLL